MMALTISLTYDKLLCLHDSGDGDGGCDDDDDIDALLCCDKDDYLLLPS